MINIKENVSASSVGFLYGKLVFETFLISEKGEVFLLDNHILRLKNSYEILFKDSSINFNVLKETILKYIKANSIKNKILRVNLSNESSEAFLTFIIRDNIYTKEIKNKGFSLKFSSVVKSSHSNIVRHKSGNYLDNLLELEKSRKEGFDDCIFKNENKYITETCIANIFFVKQGIVYTSEIETGILPGIAREYYIKTMRDNDIDVFEGQYLKNEILYSDEVFITNSAFGIIHINKIQTVSFNLGSITKKLIEYNSQFSVYN